MTSKKLTKTKIIDSENVEYFDDYLVYVKDIKKK
jgi:hypothetical protein